jgi:hypothetical protein
VEPLQPRQRYRSCEIVLPEELFDAIEQLAREEDRSRRQQIRVLLKQALAQRGINLAVGVEQ